MVVKWMVWVVNVCVHCLMQWVQGEGGGSYMTPWGSQGKPAANLTFVLLPDEKSPLIFGGDIGGVIVETLVAWSDSEVPSAVNRVVGLPAWGTCKGAVTSGFSTSVSSREFRNDENNLWFEEGVEVKEWGKSRGSFSWSYSPDVEAPGSKAVEWKTSRVEFAAGTWSGDRLSAGWDWVVRSWLATGIASRRGIKLCNEGAEITSVG